MAEPPDNPGTILESDDEIRRAQEALRAAQKPSSAHQSRTYRPTRRPPMAVLIVCDDGSRQGEQVRIRTDQFVVGQTEGDFQLPFDKSLSRRHFSITRQLVRNAWRWTITDLQSLNGVFFRATAAQLHDGMRFMVGSGAYQLNKASGDAGASPDAGTNTTDSGTRPGGGDSDFTSDHLTEVVTTGDGQRIQLNRSHYTIGADRTCEILRGNDEFVDGEHAALIRDDDGVWTIKNNGSRNGVWVGLPQVSLAGGGTCEFQAGEQRFKLTIRKRR